MKATSVMGPDWVQAAERENKDTLAQSSLNISQYQHKYSCSQNTQVCNFFLFSCPLPPTHYAALSCRLVCSFTPNMASHCALTQASRPWRSSVLSERTHHVFSCFTVCRRKHNVRKSEKSKQLIARKFNLTTHATNCNRLLLNKCLCESNWYLSCNNY